MAKVLVVEDEESWSGIYQRRLGHVLGEENVTIVRDDAAARAQLEKMIFDAYVLDGEFPRAPGQRPEPLGVPLARDISSKVGVEKIYMASGNDTVLDQAKELGINRLYSKGLPDEEKGQRPLAQLVQDLKQDLGI